MKKVPAVIEFVDRCVRRSVPSMFSVSRPRCFWVPDTCGEILNLSPKAETPEGKLKSCLLSRENRKKIFAAVGMSGVGKKTALCALGHDPEIWAEYSDGIWFIQLGQDATLDLFYSELERLSKTAVSAEFEARFSATLSGRGGAIAAITLLVQQLKDERFLLIFNDLWEGNEVYDIVRHMAVVILEYSPGLKIVISTRAEGACTRLTSAVTCIEKLQIVKFEPVMTQGITAKQILCFHTGISLEALRDLSEKACNAVEDILERCAGMPIALAFAGSAVKMNMQDASIEDARRGFPWTMFCNSMDTRTSSGGSSSGEIDHKERLFACLESGVCLMEKNWPTGEAPTPREVMSSLRIFPKQTWVPQDALQHTWRMNPEKTVDVIKILLGYSILSVVLRRGKYLLRVHDLVMDYCARFSGDNDAVWHESIVQGYARHLNKLEGEDGLCMNWWSPEFKHDAYIRRNIVRHMLGCGRRNETLRLVCDYRWVQRLNEETDHLPFRQCISDLKRLERSISNEEQLSRVVQLLRETMELCVIPCSLNRSECSFQFYGRLSSFASPLPELFDRCLWGIDKFSDRPWVKPAPGMLGGAGTDLKGSIPIPFTVRCMELGIEEGDLVLGGDDGELAIMNMYDGRVRWKAKGHEGLVTGLEIDKQTKEVFSSSSDGTVVVWRGGERVQQFGPFSNVREFQRLSRFRFFPAGGEVPEVVVSMKLVHGPRQIACGSSKGKIRLVDVAENPGNVRKALTVSNVPISSLGTSEDGEVLVSVSADTTVSKWQARTAEILGEPIKGHKNDVCCVFLSPNGCLMASGSDDGMVRLWNEEGQSFVCDGNIEHSDSVVSAIFGHKSDCFFSASNDETLIWDAHASRRILQMKRKLSHENSVVTAVCLSRDGEELFAASHERRHILVWRATDKELLQNIDSGRASHQSVLGRIQAFGISPDGETMATCCVDSRYTIELRGISELVSGDSCDGSMATCPVTSEVVCVGHIAVTSDKRCIAYCERGYGDPVVYVAKMSNGQVLHKLECLAEWRSSPIVRTQSYRYRKGHITNISFDSDGTSLTVQTCIRQVSDDRWITKSEKWNLSSSEPSPVEGDSIQQPVLSIRNVNAREAPFGHEVYISSTNSDNIIGGTLDEAPYHSCYDEMEGRKRLWIVHPDTGLKFVDLILEGTADSSSTPPSIPVLPHTCYVPPAVITDKPSSKFTVFISYSGPDKPLVDWLHDTLSKLGISVFAAKREIAVGEVASEVMIEAMENADIAIIILSPEYPAKKWTMKELLCFQRRKREAKKRGKLEPAIIPLYFRMKVRDCMNLNNIMGMKYKSGENVFTYHRFYDRLDELSVQDMHEALKELAEIQGIESPEGISYEPQPQQSEAEWREELEKILTKVVEAVSKKLPTFGK